MSCYGCACEHCVYNSELSIWDFTIREVTDEEDICFSCDECRNYDGDRAKRNQYREACSHQRLAEKYLQRKCESDARAAERIAINRRKSFRIIEGSGKEGTIQ